MLGATDPYLELPYFFSDQYDVGMEYLGFVAGPDAYDEVVVSGSVPDRELVAFWVRTAASRPAWPSTSGTAWRTSRH